MAERYAVFVYGSLLSGQTNNRLLAHSELVGNATVAGVLYSLGSFPGLRLDPSGGIVRGEVWLVDSRALESLDRLEGTESGFYERVVCDVFVESRGCEWEAFAYQISERWIRGCPQVASGDWRLR